MTWPCLAILLAAGVLYLAHALGRLAGVIRGKPQGTTGLWGLLAAALALHGAFLIARAVQLGGLPVATRLDSLALFLGVTGVVFVACRRPYRLEGVAAVFWPLFAVGMLLSWLLAGRTPSARASLSGFWLVLHLVPVYVGYAGFAVAAGAGVGYLVQETLLRRKQGAALWRRLPSLETLERVGRGALSLGFPAVTLGLVAGMVWAMQGSALLGRGWYADPKVVGGMVVWLFYAAVLHVRLLARVRGRRAALLTVVGFLLTVASFLAAHWYEEPETGSSRPPAVGRERSS